MGAEPDREELYGRADPAKAARRDRRRLARRDRGRSFWRSLALVGSVGWPIVTLATAGAFFGHMLDVRWHAGVRWALVLLTLGTTIGCWMAWRAARGGGA